MTPPKFNHQIAKLEPGKSESFKPTYTVTEADICNDITNTATTNGTDPCGGAVGPESASVSVPTTYNADLSIVKTASLTGSCPGSDPLAVDIGDTVTYCFNVTNTGDVNLTGVTVVDDIYGPVPLAKRTLEPLEYVVAMLTHVVVESDAPSVTNTANATGTDPLGGTVTDTDNCTVNVMIDPEIYVNKTAHPAEGTVGTDITFTINVANTGDCTLNPVKVIDELQQGLSYVSSDPPADTHNGILIWNNVGPLAPEESTIITVVAHIDTEAAGVLNNSVTATGTNPVGELVTDNDTAQVAVMSVGLEKTGSPTTVAPGGNVTYTINYTNTGAVPLHDVVITEHYPKGVTFISASPAPDAGTNNVWTIGTLLPGESGTIVIKVKVPEPIDLSFTETGSVIGEGVVMVTKDLSTEQKPYSLKNRVTLSCDELAPVSRYATTKVSGVPGTSLGITESGSGLYSSDEILDLETKNKTIILEKSTHAEYKPTSFNFSDSFSVNFTNKWKQDICSRNMEIDAAIHKKISDATYIDDETISRVDKDKSIMNFDSSFNGSMYIGARTKDTEISETYIGEFDVSQTIQIAKGPIPTPMPTPTPIWLPCPFNASPEMNMTEEAEPTP